MSYELLATSYELRAARELWRIALFLHPNTVSILLFPERGGLMRRIKPSFRSLEVWKRAMDLTTNCYRSTEKFPREERFGLSSQVREAAVSVPANIAEGKGRGYSQDFHRFVRIAMGSLAELETLLEVALRLDYLDRAEAVDLRARTDEVGRMLSGLAASLIQPAGSGRHPRT